MKKHPFAFIISTVFIVGFIVCVMALFLYTQFVAPRRPAQPTILRTDAVKNKKYSITTSTRAGWNVYTDYDNNFSIEYPTSWLLDNSTSGRNGIVFTYEPGGMGLAGVMVVTTTETLQDFAQSYQPTVQVDVGRMVSSTTTIVTINGQKAIQYHYGYPRSPEVETFVIYNNKLYKIFQSNSLDAEGELMLESFKILS